MRSGLDATTASLYSSGSYDVHWRLKVANGSGTLKSLQGRYFGLRFRQPDPHEPIGSLNFQVIRDSTISGAAGSLSPLVAASTFNKLDDTTTYSPLLQLGRSTTLDIHLTAVGASRPADGSANWYEVFKGIITKVAWPKFDDGTLSIDCNDIGAILQHAKSEAAYTYAASTSLETVVAQILSNNGFGSWVTYFPVATGKVLPNTYSPGLQKTVWSQLQAVAQSMGWVAYHRYRGQNPVELTFFAPARSKTVPDMTVRADDFSMLDLDEAEVRNVGFLVYVDGAGIEQMIGPQVDTASITKYGNIRRPFWIKLDKNSPVRASTEATEMLTAALSDVADPDIVAIADTVPLVFAESGTDLYDIPANTRFFDSGQSWALFGNTVNVASDAEARSSVGLRGVPTAGMKSWKYLATVLPTENRIRLYFQATAPTNPNIGDEWIESDNNNIRYRWSGTAWILIPVEEINAVDGSIAGLTITGTELSFGSIKIQGPAERILFGAATAPLTGVGIFIGKDGTDYEIRAGDPAGAYIHWNGAALTVRGAIIESPASGTSLGILGWSHDIVFSATDADTVSWTSGTISLQNGVTYSIVSGNTGNMTATTYIYLDSAASTTVLQTTQSASVAVGANKILVAVAKNTSAANNARFQVYGGSGSVGIFVTADEIAANTIVGNHIVANTLSATHISSLSFSGKTATFDTGSIGGWTLAAGELSSGSVKIQSSAERILMGSATAPLTGTGVFIGKDGTDYEFRAGNPSGDYIHFDGTTFTIKTDTFTGNSPVFTNAVTVRAGTGQTRVVLTNGSAGIFAGGKIDIHNSSGTLRGEIGTDNSSNLYIYGHVGIELDPGNDLVRILAPIDEVLRLDRQSASGSPYITFYQSGTRRVYYQYENATISMLHNNEAGGGFIFRGTTVNPMLTLANAQPALRVGGALSVTDGITAPGTLSGQAIVYVDSADGDLKVKFGDGVVKTLATDT